MFMDDPNDSEDRQKLKNLLLFKIYATNEDRDSVMAWTLPVIIVVALVAWLCGR